MSLYLMILFALSLSVTSVQAVGVDLVTNGGFETGDFTGWTQSGDTSSTSVVDGDPFGAHSGTRYLLAGPASGVGWIGQLVPTPYTGPYELTFWLASDGGAPSTLVVEWGWTLTTFESLPASGYTMFQLPLYPAVVSPSPLSFGFYSPNGYFGIDDISVTAVPLPCAAALLGSGLIGLAVARRKKRWVK